MASLRIKWVVTLDGLLLCTDPHIVLIIYICIHASSHSAKQSHSDCMQFFAQVYWSYRTFWAFIWLVDQNHSKWYCSSISSTIFLSSLLRLALQVCFRNSGWYSWPQTYSKHLKNKNASNMPILNWVMILNFQMFDFSPSSDLKFIRSC